MTIKASWYGKPDVEYVNGRVWRVSHEKGPWGLHIHGLLGGALKIEPYAGMLTDFASIPKIAWQIIGPPTGYGKGREYGPAAVIHDMLYMHMGIPFCSPAIEFSRETCDLIFRLAMESLDVDEWRRKLMYAAVRAGGWKYFGKIEKLSKLRGYEV